MAVVIQVLQAAKRHPVHAKKLQKEVAKFAEFHRATRLESVLAALETEGSAIALGDNDKAEYFWSENLTLLRQRLCAILQAHHTRSPYDEGMKSGEVRKRFSEAQTSNSQRSIDPRLYELVVASCKTDGLIVEGSSGLRLSSFTPQSRSEDELVMLENSILRHAHDGFCSRMNPKEMAELLQTDPRAVTGAVARMVDDGRLIRIRKRYPFVQYLYMCSSTAEWAMTELAGAFAARPKLRAGEIREVLGQTRKTVIPFLDYLDSIGFTCRDGDIRQLATMNRRHTGVP